LAKLEILDSESDNIKESVVNSGISESILFPDLEGLARELKNEFGFYSLPEKPEPAVVDTGVPSPPDST
jgi:hypothetical protein